MLKPKNSQTSGSTHVREIPENVQTNLIFQKVGGSGFMEQ
jgi:hypothetical protein